MSEPRLWQDMTAPQLAEARTERSVVLLPIGAIEQHGSHLPVDTDIAGAYESAVEASRRCSYAIVAPPVWWGLSGAHREFPGLLTLRRATFVSLLEDLCTSMVDQGFEKIALIVGHAPNKPVVQAFVGEYMEDHGTALLQLNYVNLAAELFGRIRKSKLGGASHAGELETSLQMHLRPGQIMLDAAPVHYIDPKRDFGLSAAKKDMFSAGEATVGFDFKASFPDGVMGDPTLASAETGRQLFAVIVERLCAILDEYREL